MGRREAKDAIFDTLAGVAKALGSGRRTEIIDVLSQGERSVEDLAGVIEQSTANTSHHLQVLARSGLVDSRRDGTRVYYHLASERVGDLWAALRDVASERVPGFEDLVRAYVGKEDGEAISRGELAGRLGDERLVLLDVRPLTEFEAGHIPSARAIPPEELRDHLDEIPPDSEVVAYCRGPYCVYASDAVRALRDRGLHARRLEEGFPEWRREGLPVEADAAAAAAP